VTSPLPERRRQLRDERAEFVALLTTLEPEDWTRPTRCEGWTVADVAAHVLAWEDVLAAPTTWSRAARSLRLLALACQARFDVDRLNDRLLRQAQDRSGPGILERFGRRRPERWKWRFDRLSPDAQLAEYVLHHDDVLDAVGRTRTIPPDRLSSAIAGVERLPGVRGRRHIVATPGGGYLVEIVAPVVATAGKRCPP
jgi:uncharacterized protein (TIGR03083 family)